MSDKGRQAVWKKSTIEQVKVDIRAELDSVALPGPDGERLNYAIERCLVGQSDHSPEGQLKTYVYIMSALVEHSRHGGLSDSNLKRLFQLAEKILKFQRIPIENSSLSFLYGDLYLVMSQIHRLQGDLVDGLWQEQVANFLTQRASHGRIYFQSLSIGIQLLRMGYGTLALEELLSVSEAELDPVSKSRWILETHMALRLAGRLDEAQEFSLKHEEHFKAATEVVRSEWEWEKLCRESQRTGNIDALMVQALPKKKFSKSPYSVEAYLFARIISSKQWMDRYKVLPAKQKSNGPSKSRYEVFWLSAKAIKDGYEQELDYVSRLKTIGGILGQMSQLRSVFHELLVRAALVRWLMRRPTQVFAKVSIVEYQTLCMKLSGGTNHDVLNLLADVPNLLDKTGFKKAA